MKIKITTLVISCLITGGLYSQPTSLSLQPGGEAGKDAEIGNLADYIDLNLGDVTELNAVAWTNGGDESDLRSFLQFDLSSIPIGSLIKSARLYLYYDPESSNAGGFHSQLSGSNAAYVSRVIEPWDEHTVTWNTQPDITTFHQVTLPASATTTQDYQVNVKKLVQDMVNDATNSYGFRLSLVNETEYRALVFCSSDHPDQSKHPKLKVVYYPEGEKLGTEIQEIQLEAYPNPAADKTMIQINTESDEHISFTMYNLQGTLVMEMNDITGNLVTVDVHALSNGIYVYQIKSENGMGGTGKLIVQ